LVVATQLGKWQAIPVVDNPVSETKHTHWSTH